MKDIETLIAEHPFFADLEDERRTLVAGCAVVAAYRAGSYLFRVGEAAEHFYLLRRGRVALEQAVPGGEPYRFETVDPGAVLGWSWLFPPHRYQFDARALQDVGVIQFDAVCLRGKCDADTALGYDLMKRFAGVLVQRYADTRLQLLDVYGRRRA
jgi:CRP/FNR family transcriptional regulator, cyclic AMP receptor protein